MRRHGPEYTFEPYDRVPDNDTVRRPVKSPLTGRLAYVGVMAILAILLVFGIVWNL